MASFKTDKQIIRDYVTAMDHVRKTRNVSALCSEINGSQIIQLQYTTLPEGVVAILMTHSNLPTKHVDIRLSLHNTVCS